MTLSLSSYPWYSLTAEKRIGDVCWQYDMRFHGHTYPPYFTDLVYIPTGQTYPIMFGHVTNATRESGPAPQKQSTATGYSMGWYLRECIPPALRHSKITTNTAGAVTAYENPTTYLKRLLWSDGDTAKPLRGFYPGTLVNVPNWATTNMDTKHPSITQKQFGFDNESIIDAINEIADHCHFILLDGIQAVNGVWRNVLHWVPEYYIDGDFAGLIEYGFPGPVTITKGVNDQDLVGDPVRTSDLNSENSKNSVQVELLRSKADKETWFYSSYHPAGYTNPRRVLKYQSPDILKASDSDTTCQNKADSKRDQLVTFISQSTNTYEATFRNRYDFRLYQAIYFAGFDATEITTVKLRIVGIRYECGTANSGGNRVTLTMTESKQWVMSRKYGLLMDEIQNQISTIEKTVYAQIRMISSGTITYVDPKGTYAVAKSDVSGELVQGRSWNQ